jgi:serine/threonine protein kinase
MVASAMPATYPADPPARPSGGAVRSLLVTAVSVPGYELLDPLGRGGFGVVYRARQVTIDREVAIKVDTRVILDERDQRRFLREVRAAGKLSGHPHVVELYDAGVLPDNRPYLVMELCPGGSLADRGRMKVREVIDVGRRIADALAAAHDLGVLHRDIKPGNILIKRYGTVALADFGLAAVVESGRDSSVTLAALTPAYAAPEAFHLQPPTERSDVYALTATLYTLLAGFPPRFPAEGDLSVPEIVRRHDTPIEDITGIPAELMAVLRRGLATDPAHRFPDAAALRAELEHLVPNAVTGPRHAVTTAVTTVAAPRPSTPRPPHPSVPPASPASPTAPVSPAGPTTPTALPPPLSGRPSGPRYGPPSQPPMLPGAYSNPPPGQARSPRRTWLIVLAAVLVAAVVAGVWYLVIRGDSAGTTPGADPPATPAGDVATYGVSTVARGCPAAKIQGAGARCTKRAQCWSSIVIISGELSGIRPLPCEQAHVYETFAIAQVPPAVVDPYQDKLAENASVRKVCSKQIMLASRYGDAKQYGADSWTIEILPPTPEDKTRGRDIYRCAATLTGRERITGSAFRPR